MMGVPMRSLENGCEFYSSCLDCPFPISKYDSVGNFVYLLRRLATVIMLREGKCRDEIVEILGISPRTLDRAVADTYRYAVNYSNPRLRDALVKLGMLDIKEAPNAIRTL